MAREARRALLMLACVCVWRMGATNYHEISYSSEDEFLHIKCKEGVTEYPIFNLTANFKTITLEGCPPPSISYLSTLTAVNINVSVVTELKLDDMPIQPPLRSSHFAGLFLKVLVLNYIHQTEMYRPDVAFLGTIANVTEILLSNVELPPLPETGIEKLKLVDGESRGEFGSCTQLRKLKLYNWNVENVTDRWLAHCHQLEDLDISLLPKKAVKALHRMLGGATNLRGLTLMNCELKAIGNEFVHLVNLQRLELPYNSLRNISVKALPTSLTKLNLVGNRLWSSAHIVEVLQGLPRLQYLELDGNPALDLCDGEVYVDEFNQFPPMKFEDLKLPALQRLSMEGTSLRWLCFGGMELNSLEILLLGQNGINMIEFPDLPASKAPHLRVDLTENDIEIMILNQTAYEALSRYNQSLSLTGLDMTLQCSCEHVWLARAVREERVTLSTVTCMRPGHTIELGAMPLEELECDKFGWDACVCKRYWRDNTTVAECEESEERIRAIPRIPGLRELHAAGNRVQMFSVEDLPDTLHLLDLRDNKVSFADAAAAAALFAQPGRIVRLADNPLCCCHENRALLTALQEHHAQVEDYDEVRCSDGRALRDVAVDSLCGSARDEAGKSGVDMHI